MKGTLLLFVIVVCWVCISCEKRSGEDDLSSQLVSLGYDYMNLSSKMTKYSSKALNAKSKKESLLYLDSALNEYENKRSELDSLTIKYLVATNIKITESDNTDSNVINDIKSLLFKYFPSLNSKKIELPRMIETAKSIQSYQESTYKDFKENREFKEDIKSGKIFLDSWKK